MNKNTTHVNSTVARRTCRRNRRCRYRICPGPRNSPYRTWTRTTGNPNRNWWRWPARRTRRGIFVFAWRSESKQNQSAYNRVSRSTDASEVNVNNNIYSTTEHWQLSSYICLKGNNWIKKKKYNAKIKFSFFSAKTGGWAQC